MFILMVVCSVGSVFAEERELIYSDDFSMGKTDWKRKGNKVKIVREDEGNKYISISRKNTRGETYIQREFKGYEGDLIFKARVKVTDFKKGAGEYDEGKFQARIERKGKFAGYAGDNFVDSFDWKELHFEVLNLAKRDEVLLMIGLQNAEGTVYVDDVRVELVVPEE
jgi:hypothetical protein